MLISLIFYPYVLIRIQAGFNHMIQCGAVGARRSTFACDFLCDVLLLQKYFLIKLLLNLLLDLLAG